MHFEQDYDLFAMNLGVADLVTRASLVPLDGTIPAQCGLTLVSDTTAAFPPPSNNVRRSRLWVSGGPTIIPVDQIQTLLTGLYTGTLATALATSVRAHPVVVTP